MAPVGSVDHFTAAVKAGADGVYAGVPGFNARNPSRELRFDELRAMAAYCREHGLVFYAAINSLVREEEIPRLINTLAQLETVAPSALIVQDLGVINLVNRFFPSFELHGSTLMLAHNSGSVEALARLGCSRVVLARELSLVEIERIVQRSPIEIEIFIHGAMCFSYSGGCLFSSYHGGKSGLRGNCVQPCRRKYSIASASSKTKSGKVRSGYFFSMNDLEGIDLVDEFERIGVVSLKIEGRLRSVNYVTQVVRAYRMVLDASAQEREVVTREAKELISSALGRKGSTGFFMGEKGQGTIASRHSGNIGIYLGRVGKVIINKSGTWALINPTLPVHAGERFRLHDEKSGERFGFTLNDFEKNSKGEYRLMLPGSLKNEFIRGDLSLYRVDIKDETQANGDVTDQSLTPLRTSNDESSAILKKSRNISQKIGLASLSAEKSMKKSARRPIELWLRLDSVQLALKRLPFSVDRFVLPIEKRTLAATGQLKRYFGREKQKIIWALPSVLHDHSFHGLKKMIEVLINSGFRSFQLSGFGQLALFDPSRVSLYGDFTLNLLNSRAIRSAAAQGLSGVQFSIETDRDNLTAALASYRNSTSAPRQRKKGAQKVELKGAQVGLTVYGTPPLFISRAESAELSHNQKVTSPRGEQFITTKKGGLSYTRPVKPFSLLPFQRELQTIGLDYMVVDLSAMRTSSRDIEELAARLNARERLPKLPTFNYLGTLA